MFSDFMCDNKGVVADYDANEFESPMSLRQMQKSVFQSRRFDLGLSLAFWRRTQILVDQDSKSHALKSGELFGGEL
jgi:hypothetical protein